MPLPDDPGTTPLTVAELDAAIAGGVRRLGKDTDRLTALLAQARLALVTDAHTIAGMRRHINEVHAYLSRVGLPTTLNPVDALKYLDDEQKAQIFDRTTREQLRELRALVDRASAERQVVAHQLEQVRASWQTMVQDPALPAHVRAEAAGHLASLPAAAAAVTRPAMLDFPALPAPERDATPVVATGAPAQPAAAPTATQAVYIDPYAAPDPIYRDPYREAP